MSWERVTFESLYAIPSKNGLTRPAHVRGSGYKMINMGELFAHDRIGAIDMELVPMNEKELDTMLVDEGDLLFARQSLVLSGAGKCSIVKTVLEETTFESHIIRVRLKKDIAYPNFFFYYFKSPQSGIKSIVTQGVQAGIRGNDLKTLPVALPPIDEQIKIADVLMNYDDLIENNRRRIQLLEESARLLYQEWFVHLRFPSHEQVKITDGVPDGWEQSILGSLAIVQSGYAFKSKDWLNAGNPVIKIKNITGDGTVDTTECDCIDDNVAEQAQKFKLDGGDFLIAMTGATVGKVGIMPRDSQSFYLNQRVGKFFFLSDTAKEFLYCLTSTKYFRTQIENLAGGAAQPNISGKQIESINILRPSDKLLSLFSEQTRDAFEQRQLLIETNRKLAQARDLLLPKLMTGGLVV